jgi:2-polyprenyl-3-methyl-5-hydroxy-6-metoxy-1,4-benzoquinol methylase
MPTLEWNLLAWNSKYDWTQQGEEWSEVWGGSELQWFGAIFPRIHAFVEAETILEIAPGFGRWTNYLKEHCDHFIGVDLAESCIEFCRKRFASESHMAFHVNDGKSLQMIQDNSIDFVFSFDSLVHAESDVLRIYLNQLAKKLKPNGVGFIHHSNLGEYQQILSLIERFPTELRNLAINKSFLSHTHFRAASMTAKLFEVYCDKAGLKCISQELVNWGTDGLLIDCFSLFTPRNSLLSRPNRIIENTDFMKEAFLIKRLSDHYSVKSFQSKSKDQS